MHRLLWDAEGAANTNRREISVVHKAIDRHLRNPHNRRYFRHGQELDVTKGVFRSVGHDVIRSRPCRLPGLVEGNTSREGFPAKVDSQKNFPTPTLSAPRRRFP